jgi:hypothetical protein
MANYRKPPFELRYRLPDKLQISGSYDLYGLYIKRIEKRNSIATAE